MNASQEMIDMNFLEQIGMQQIIHMFDLLPGTLFWIKNESSQILYANQALLDTFGFKSLADIVGKSDETSSPPHLAR